MLLFNQVSVIAITLIPFDFMKWDISVIIGSEEALHIIGNAEALHYRKRGSASYSYIVREVLLVRERERDTEREIDGSDVTIVALKFLVLIYCA